MVFSTKIRGNHHLQGNVQVYNVRIPVFVVFYSYAWEFFQNGGPSVFESTRGVLLGNMGVVVKNGGPPLSI